MAYLSALRASAFEFLRALSALSVLGALGSVLRRWVPSNQGCAAPILGLWGAVTRAQNLKLPPRILLLHAHLAFLGPRALPWGFPERSCGPLGSQSGSHFYAVQVLLGHHLWLQSSLACLRRLPLPCAFPLGIVYF